eukprot:1216946-Rhodomonas_salina.1
MARGKERWRGWMPWREGGGRGRATWKEPPRMRRERRAFCRSGGGKTTCFSALHVMSGMG